MEREAVGDSIVGESSSSNGISSSSDKTVIVRVKRKLSQSPLEALWVEINERPLKRPLLDFQKLSISSKQQEQEREEELNRVKRVLVKHVETLPSSQASLHFLQSYLQACPEDDSKFKASSKEHRRTHIKENKHEHLLSKAKQQHEELAKTARFEQIWKRRTPDDRALHDEALNDMCRVYDVLRVDREDRSTIPEVHEEISAEDQELLSKFLPLLKEYIPGAAQEIESDVSFQAAKQGHSADSVGEYVYDLYAVEEEMDDTEAAYPFPLVQVDDDDQLYDGLDDSDYETDDSNAELHPRNDYPDEESSDEEEKSETSGTESEEDGSETESDILLISDDSVCLGRTEDPFCDDEMDDDSDEGSCHTDFDDAGNEDDWRWVHR